MSLLRSSYGALGVALFVVLEFVLILFVDEPVSRTLRTVDHDHTALINFFRSWTDLGKSCWYLWPSGVALLLGAAWLRWGKIEEARRARLRGAVQMLAFFFASVALSGIIADIIKPIFGRARPVELEKDNFYGFHPGNFHYTFNSLPSGHATTAFAVAFALGALKPSWRPWLLIYAVALALSRVMVNAHFCSDVVGGAAVGIVTTLVLERTFRRRGWLSPVNQG